MEDFIIGGLVFSVFLGIISGVFHLLYIIFGTQPSTQQTTKISTTIKPNVPQIKPSIISQSCFPFDCVNNNGIISFYFSKEKADSFYFPTTKEGFRTSRIPITYFLSSFASNGSYKNNDFVKKGEKIIKINKNITPNKNYVFDISSLPIISDVDGYIKYHNNYAETKPLEDGELCFTIDTNITSDNFYDFNSCVVENNDENNEFKITLPVNIGYAITQNTFKIKAITLKEGNEHIIGIYKNYERQDICHTFRIKKLNSISLNNVTLYLVKDDETNEVKEYYIKGEYVLRKENNTATYANKGQLLYIMHDIANNAYKIGISNNPKNRERTLQSDKPSIGLFKIYVPKGNETAYGIEQYLHRKYAHKQWKRADKKISEWFALTEDDMKELLSLYDWKDVTEI